MYKGKLSYLEKLSPKFPSVKFGRKIDGSTPPSVFIGRKNYPKVFVGPLMAQEKGDTTMLDAPESWLGEGMNAQRVSEFRFQLARGMTQVKITDLDNKIVGTVRDIALSRRTLNADAEFTKNPRGYSMSEHHQPFGPSAPLKSVEIENVKYQKHMEKAYYDTDLKAGDAVVSLYKKDLLISQIQKAFSTGAFGIKRKMVPTRWSITAVDDTISKSLLESIRTYPTIDNYMVYEYRAFSNYFVILLTPTQWQYEFLEVFMSVLGNETMLFSDSESYHGRKNYAQIGGCYYSTRLALAEKLDEMKKQSGAIVFRESYPGYVPLGVWLVRECAREALKNTPKEFHDMNAALGYTKNKLILPFSKYRKESKLLRQTTLNRFLVGSA